MSSKNAATVTNPSPASDATTGSAFRAAHNGHALTHVGQVVNTKMPQTTADPRGGVPTTFDVWYCQNDHVVFLDNS